MTRVADAQESLRLQFSSTSASGWTKARMLSWQKQVPLQDQFVRIPNYKTTGNWPKIKRYVRVRHASSGSLREVSCIIRGETFLSQQQAVRAPGFLGGGLLLDAHRTFWTLTVWESERTMKAFRGIAPHAKVLPRLVEWCDEASYAHWIPTGASVPPGRRHTNIW